MDSTYNSGRLNIVVLFINTKYAKYRESIIKNILTSNLSQSLIFTTDPLSAE